MKDIRSKTNLGILRQKEKGFVSVRIKATAGMLTAENLENISDISRKYGRGDVGLTTRLNIEIPWIKRECLDDVRTELDRAGLVTGSTGATVRGIVTCKGTVCTHGLFDTQSLARALDEAYFGEELPRKFKIGIAGCPNNCTKMQFNDLGFIGQKIPLMDESNCNQCGACIVACKEKAIEDRGDGLEINYDKCINCGACIARCPSGAITTENEGLAVYLGGRAGRKLNVGTKVNELLSIEDCVVFTGKILEYFKIHARKNERFCETIERIGPDRVLGDLGLSSD